MGKMPEAPQPEGISDEEKSLLRKQGLALDQAGALLSEENLEKQEVQDVLRELTGLYKEETTPGGFAPDTVKYTVDDTRLGELKGLVNRAKEININEPGAGPMGMSADLYGQLQAQFGQQFVDSAANYSVSQGGRIAKPLVEQHKNFFSVLENQLKRVGNLANADNTLLSTISTSQDPSLAFQQSFLTSESIKGEALPDITKTVLDPAQLADLRRRIGAEAAQQESLRTQSQAVLEQALTPSATQQAQTNIGLLQSSLAEKDLASQLGKDQVASILGEEKAQELFGDKNEIYAVSEIRRQQRGEEFGKMKEALARRGIEIEGDDPDSAVALSTPGVQALRQFRERNDVLDQVDIENQRTSARSFGLQNTALLSDLAGQQAGVAGSLYNPTGAYTASQLGLLGQYGGGGAIGTQSGGGVGGYLGLANAYGQGLGVYADQRGFENQVAIANAQLEARQKAAGLGLAVEGGQAGAQAGYKFGGPWGAVAGGAAGSIPGFYQYFS